KISGLASELVEDSAPVGVMIFSNSLDLLYHNLQAREYCQDLGENPFSTRKPSPDRSGSILDNCLKIRERMKRPPLDLPSLPIKEVVDSPSRKYLIHTHYLNRDSAALGLKSFFVIKIEPIGKETGPHQLRIDPSFGLTHREVEIVRCLFEGRTNTEIGEKLYISEITVKKHIQNICGKMGVKNRTAILSNILKSQIII
ncbi:MAG: helix-turn-helix transcriptional regulator, partial [Thermodesulfobacteriota bacterium]